MPLRELVCAIRGVALRMAIGLALLADTASAQFINRAVWLGDDLEPFVRDYSQDEDYFLDRSAYVEAPPWWFGEDLDPFANRLYAAGGSVTSKRLTLESVANAGIELGRGFTGRFHYLQSEHQATQFQRFAVGLDKALSDSSAMFFQLEGTPDKSRADLSLGMELFRSETSAHRLSFTMVDFSKDKSSEFEYERQPYGVLLAGFSGDPEVFDLSYEVGVQLPFEEMRVEENEVLSMNRTIGSVRASAPLSGRDRLILGLEGELTSKELEPAGLGFETEDGDVEKGRVWTEWWRRGQRSREYSFGAYFLSLDEDYLQSVAPDDGVEVRRRELMLFSRLHFTLGGGWRLEPYVFGGHVDLEERTPEDPVPSDFNGFQGKLGLPLRFDFSEHAWMRFDLSMQLDEFAFGGGGVQLVASF